MTSTRVLIVGAGPTGAALALLLARSGVPVALIEAEPSFDRIFRGEGMMPSGIDALLQMGLGERLARLPHRKLDTWEYYIEGELLMRFAEPDRSAPTAIRVLSQPHLLDAIIAEAVQHPAFELIRGVRVRELAREGATIVLRGHGEGGSRELRGEYLIGTDGRGSIIRKLAGLPIDRSHERDPGSFDALWCSLPLPAWLAHETVFYGFAATDSLGTMYPSAAGELRAGWFVPKEHSRELRRRDMLAELARLAPGFVADFIHARRDEASEVSFFNVVFGRCPSWSASGVLLLGDAAHPMNPNRAQGINLGLRDAIVAANHLIPALRAADRDALDRAALAIQHEREPEIALSQRRQAETFAPPPPLRRRWFRRGVMPVLRGLGLPQRLLLRADRELRYGSVPVRLDRA